MITGYNKNNNNSAMFENKEMMGLSTDEKPSEQVPVNALFLELDTGDFYYLESQSTESEVTEYDDEFGAVYPWDVSIGYTATFAGNSTLDVIYDGVEYPSVSPNGNYSWGASGTAPDSIFFGDIPFKINYYTSPTHRLSIYCSTTGEHSFVIKVNGEIVFEQTLSVPYFQGSYTTENPLTDIITVNFDGAVYVLEPKISDYEMLYYGAPPTDVAYDFSQYPINFNPANGVINIDGSYGGHQLTIEQRVVTEAVWKKVGEGSSPTPPTPTPTKYYAIETSETGHDVYMGVAHYSALIDHDMKCDVTDTNGITVTIDMEAVDSNVWEGSDELFEVSINGIVQDTPAYEVWITPKTELAFAVSFSFYSLEPLTTEPIVSDKLG